MIPRLTWSTQFALSTHDLVGIRNSPAQAVNITNVELFSVVDSDGCTLALPHVSYMGAGSGGTYLLGI